MGWIILVLLGVGAFFVYSYLVALEKEIRAGIDPVEDEVSSPSESQENPKSDSPVGQVLSLDQRIEQIVSAHPGMLQSDLYLKISDTDKKVLQNALLNLDRSGRILRKRSGRTFQLNIAD